MSALSKVEREALDEPIYDADLDMHQRSDRVEQVVERILAARAAAPDARVEALRQAAEELRRQGVERMCVAGPHDARGAALWDAGYHIDPENGDALRVGRKALDERPAT